MTDPLDDLLDEVLGEIRCDTHGPAPMAGESRKRVLASSARKRRRYDTLVAAAAAICVLFVAPAVWAQVTGRLPSILQAVGLYDTPVAPTSRNEGRRGTAEAPIVETEPEVAIAELEPEASIAELEPEAPTVEVQLLPQPAPAVVTPEASPLSADLETRRRRARSRLARRERLLFGRAHDAHFQGGQPTAALAAWDQYLRAFPDGEFSPEARYNRAAALLRLERFAEARGALAPFAEGSFGSLRQTEAQHLLQAIDGRLLEGN